MLIALKMFETYINEIKMITKKKKDQIQLCACLKLVFLNLVLEKRLEVMTFEGHSSLPLEEGRGSRSSGS